MSAGVTFFDLTQPLSQDTPVTCGMEHAQFFNLHDLVSYGVLIKGIRVCLHEGTHIDAPTHFPGSTMSLDQIPVSTLCGTGVVLDMTRDAFGVITGDDLEAATPRIERGDRVILNTGWHHHYLSDSEKYILEPPGCDKSAIDWFVERGVSWVGSDAPSPDHTFCLSARKAKYRPDVYTPELLASIDRDRFPRQYGHRTLLKNNIPMVEYVGGDLDAVTGMRLTLLALPPKYVDAEAAQVRVVAMTD